jgi:hypothetical protein
MKATAIVIGWYMALALGAGAVAGEKISGRATLRLDPETSLNVSPDTEDHQLVLRKGTGTNDSAGDARFFDGGVITSTAVCDLRQGNGTCSGYQTLVAKDGGSVTLKYSELIQAIRALDDQPEATTVRGTWVFLKGSGKYAGIRGGGAYQGKYVSKTEVELEWSGEHNYPVATAKRD